jgi:putative transcriptional regulator
MSSFLGQRLVLQARSKIKAMPRSIDLTHHFLIAMPGMDDAVFSKSVVYVCEHTERGALGLVINKPTELKLTKLFEKVDLPLSRADLIQAPVFEGGPVQTERGFVLHEQQFVDSVIHAELWDERMLQIKQRADIPALIGDEGQVDAEEEKAQAAKNQADDERKARSLYASSLTVAGAGIEMTTSKDVLEAISVGGGPRRVLVSLGYSAWGQGQLESELAENAWLTVAADPAVIFDTPPQERYTKALSLLGLQEWTISREAGRA